MTIAPTRESAPAPTPDPVEVLIKEARRRGRRHRLAVGLIVIAVLTAFVVAAIAFSVGASRKGAPANTKRTIPTPIVVRNAPRCPTSALLVSYEGTLAGTGHWNNLFTLRNASNHDCSIAGFPSVRFLASDGRAIWIPIGYGKGGCTRWGCGVGGLRYHGAFPRAILVAHTGVASFFIEG